MAETAGTAVSLEKRMDALRKTLEQLELGALIVTSRPAIMYLTGFAGEGHERLIAVVATSRESTLIVPALEEEAAREQSAGVELRVWRDGEDPLVVLAEHVRAAGPSPKVGAEEKFLSLEQADFLRED
ncbi:MAG: aminopeptidase P family N-terminal domain-containing protein, partial [Gaiellales bacterium]